MYHQIDPGRWGPLGQEMAEAVRTCVHCGFCLSACPTYLAIGNEADSPRGRIVLMKGALEGTLPFLEARPHIDRCLGCLACEPACPSGVQYGALLAPFRSALDEAAPRSWWQRLRRRSLAALIPHPGRFRLALRLAQLARPLRPLLPMALRAPLDLAPARLPPRDEIYGTHPTSGKPAGQVALLAGCAQQVLAPEIGRAAIRLLNHFGYQVVVPPAQACCGALGWHQGDAAHSRAFARQNLVAFPDDIPLLTTAAGCGAGLKEYPHILAATPDQASAAALAARVQDVSVFLAPLIAKLATLSSQQPAATGEAAPPPRPLRVAYQDACHLLSAQRISAEPRQLLAALPGVELVEIPDGALCCGSAGTYNLDQPQLAHQLGQSKARAILDLDVDVVASGNIGCLAQLQHHLALLAPQLDRPAPEVCHTVVLAAHRLLPAANNDSL
jgi:glycolate oxidase iron-sulfur subunit